MRGSIQRGTYRRRWLMVAVIVVGLAVLVSAAYATLISPVRSLSGSPTAPGESSGTRPAGSPSPAPGSPSRTGGGAGSGSNGAPSGVPMPLGNQPGWQQVLAEDFPGSSLDSKWVAYKGQPLNDPGGYFDPSRVSVGDGMLTIGAWRDPARRNIYVSGGIKSAPAFSQTYGRYEIRFRMDRGTGIAYALLLWPSSNRALPEIDIAEDNGKLRDRTYSTVHSADGGVAIEHSGVGDFTQWHTVGLEWSPGKAVFTLDGKVWATVDNPAVSSMPMSLALQSQAWYCGNSWQACPGASTPARVNLNIDWVVVYRRVG